MNELTEGILQLSYSPAINVYIVWILGFAFIYKMNSLLKKSVDELTEEEKESYTGAGVIKDGKWNTLRVRLISLFAIPFLGIINDFIFAMIGGPAIILYSKLWWGQFLSLGTIMGMLG